MVKWIGVRSSLVVENRPVEGAVGRGAANARSLWRECLVVFGLCGIGALGTSASRGEEPNGAAVLTAAEGALTLTVPTGWTVKEPAIRMIEHELSAPVAEGDTIEGRATLMAAGGSVDANLDRWRSQFTGAQGGAPTVKQDVVQVQDHKIHVVDLAGTYQDRRGPAAPAVARPNYRMLGAIFELPGGGLYFIKFYGPQATIDKHTESFRGMLTSAKFK